MSAVMSHAPTSIELPRGWRSHSLREWDSDSSLLAIWLVNTQHAINQVLDDEDKIGEVEEERMAATPQISIQDLFRLNNQYQFSPDLHPDAWRLLLITIAGREPDRDSYAKTYIRLYKGLSSCKSPHVRDGAYEGLIGFKNVPEAKEILERAAREEPHPSLRGMVKGSLAPLISEKV